MNIKKVSIPIIVVVVMFVGVVVFNKLNNPKQDVNPIYTLEIGTSIPETIELLGEPYSVDEDQDSVRSKVKNLRDNILSTNKSMSVDANIDIIELLTMVLEDEDAEFVCYNYEVIENTKDGKNHYYRALYFVDGKLIFN